ncbi:phenylacetate-CoA ligase [Winogradskyella epiphytica]|uniref:Phenylacetate-CoA ligase n=1 Tax=Winogradskyella epiphytica TaxID=262005 RepID=A0A2V4WYH6_9FLAO|nr:phenylacetate--CoA ligase family protein [Winogradskyella epiphytica]PYE82702.1 phenylacetate-CoA ligase [Winogradskyella epiphytica]GGW53075.1 AMP-binding protein [Winogradskyella epiphytica]
MKESVYKLMPHSVQNLFVTGYNIIQYRKRYGGKYNFFLQHFLSKRSASFDELKTIQNERFLKLLGHAIENSKYYQNLYKDAEMPTSIGEIAKLPIISKEMLRQNIDDVVTIDGKDAIHLKTGGTTGKSLEVLFTLDNNQERFAMLDDFRGRMGYQLGKKTAWFSGKSLLTSRDLKRNRFWKTDIKHHVRYYSTFHIKDDYLKYYVEDLIKFQPEFLSGFPSTMFEIAKHGLKYGHEFPANTVKAVFPTAESVTPVMRSAIETFFKTKMYNQYASSEGAPFICECKHGNLHLELQSGVFEVLDKNDRPTKSGRLVITSFTTEGTPLIRYDIGDSITLEDETKVCGCGNNNPMVKEILGRVDDYVYSPENGKINLGNVSNTLKDTKGIIRFQAVQNEINTIDVLVVVDSEIFNDKIEQKFIQNWRDRIGDKMGLNIRYMDDIPTEKSGKFRIVKNNIKHLVNT